MHMADALMSPAVGMAMWAVSAGSAVYAAGKMRDDDVFEKKIPIMAVLGSFIFAAQMINFTIPATGSSGHIGGGVLLAALLGPYPSFLAIAVILAVQCLFFADGGLLALGCNIFNLGVIPCLAVYPLVFRHIAAKAAPQRRFALGAVLAAVLSLQLGSLAVALETFFSGVTRLPFSAFLLLMQPIHLAIGITEGLVTASILCFVHSARPEITAGVNTGGGFGTKKIVLAFAAGTLLAGGVLSSFASSQPDGLEWSIEKTAGSTELDTQGGIFEKAAEIQNTTAFLPNYNFTSPEAENSSLGTPAAGIAGGSITFLLVAAAGLAISKTRKTDGGRPAASP